jgi:PKD repeat protein
MVEGDDVTRKLHSYTVCMIIIIAMFISVDMGLEVVEKGRITLYVKGETPITYSSLQDAIDDSDDGDMIYLSPGEYEIPKEIVGKGNLAICGESSKTTIIKEDRKPCLPDFNPPPFEIYDSHGVYVSGISIHGGVRIGHSTDIHFSDCEISILSSVKFDAYDSSEIYVTNTKFWDEDDLRWDIQLYETDDFVLEGCNFWHWTFFMDIWDERPGQVTLMDSHITIIQSSVVEPNIYDSSTFSFGKYMTVEVKDIDGDAVEDATVWINDTFETNVHTTQTDVMGLVTELVPTSIKNSSSKTYREPHNITAIKDSVKGVENEVWGSSVIINLNIDVLGPPPIADAGSDQTVYSRYPVYFDGSGSYDPNGYIDNYTWNFNDGSPHGFGVNPTHRFLSTGVYSVILTVTDDDGRTDSDSCKIKVLLSPTPFAYAGSDQIVGIGDIVEFSEGRSFYLNEHWETETVDLEGDVGSYNSIAIDSSGKPHISYYNYVPPPDPPDPPCGDPLKYARWTGSDWITQIVDSQGVVGTHTSIALDSYNKPHISYCDETNWRLKYATRSSSRWSIESVDFWPTGEHTSIALDSNNYPHIAYDDDHERAVKYAYKTASGWSTEIVCKGTWASIVLDSQDNPHISIIDLGVLKYARRIGSTWLIEVVDTVACKEVGTSLALDKNDNPHISYFDNSFNLKYARWVNDQWNFEIVDTSLGNSAESSLALDAYDNPHICYTKYGGLRYAEKTINTWHIESVDYGVGYPGKTVSIALDSNCDPHISYYDRTENDLKYAKERESIISYDWDFGDDSPHSTDKNPTHIYTTCGVYTVTLTVTDGGGHTGSDTCIITVGIPISLDSGWNLISLPTIQNDSDIQSVLQSIKGDYDALQWYDASDSSDSWKNYQVSKPSYFNDLSEINHEMGIWIHVTKAGGTTLYSVGDRPATPRFLTLHFGWNLVGYPSNLSMPRDEALNTLFFGSEVDVIQYYNSSEGRFKILEENDLMEPGKGYYIHAQNDCVWEVPL